MRYVCLFLGVLSALGLGASCSSTGATATSSPDAAIAFDASLADAPLDSSSAADASTDALQGVVVDGGPKAGSLTILQDPQFPFSQFAAAFEVDP
jgi:hypothetical protein